MAKIHVVSFYRFTPLHDCRELQVALKALMEGGGLKGTILLAEEGINATIAGKKAALDDFLNHLMRDERFAGLECKHNACATMPFDRAKVRLKKEIIPLGMTYDPSLPSGKKLTPQEWNALLAEEDVLLLDTRNAYEIVFGSFQKAENPNTRHFRELKEYADKKLDGKSDRKIAIYCTGGIRCEKYSAYLMRQGFTEIYQLQGGILNYIEQIPEAESRWQGECYVFDRRTALRHDLSPLHD